MKKLAWLLVALMLLNAVVLQAQGESEVTSLSYSTDEHGVAFTVELIVDGYREQDLDVYMWFYDPIQDGYVYNPSAHESFRTNGDALRVIEDIRPCCDTTYYADEDGSLDFYMPYSQFPAETEQFYPVVAVYQGADELFRRSFADDVLPVENPPVLLHGMTTEITDDSIIYSLDMSVHNRRQADLDIYIWLYSDDLADYVRNPAALGNYRTTDNSLIMTRSIHPCCVAVNYTGSQSLEFEMPFRQLPDGVYDFYPFVEVYEGDELIGRRTFEDVVLSHTDSEFFAPDIGAAIQGISYQFEEAGLRMFVDFEVNGYAGQNVDVYAWFRAASSDEVLINPLEDETYSNADNQLRTAIRTEACCEQTVYTNAELYIPYNQFPSPDYRYRYYPQIQIVVNDDEVLTTRHFTNQQIEVLGDENPVGYIVQMNFPRLYVHEVYAGVSLGYRWDDVLVVYGMHEIDRHGTLVPGDQSYWTESVFPRNRYSPNGDAVYLDVLATSNLVVDLELWSLANIDATQDYIDGLKDARRAAQRGAQRLIPRLLRSAATGALRYVNGFLLIQDIASLFRQDTEISSDSLTFTPAQLYAMWQDEQNSPAILANSIRRQDFEFRGIEALYQGELMFRFYGYAGHRAVE